MKKMTLYCSIAIAAATIFSSCRKDFTCACTVGVPLVYDTTINIEIKDEKKRIARKTCEHNEETIQTVSAVFIGALAGSVIPDSLIGSGLPPNFIVASCKLK